MTDNENGPDKKMNSMAMPDNSGPDDDYRELQDIKPRKLILDDNNYRPAKTGQQLYNELKLEEKILDQDIYQYASYVERGAALLLDSVFVFILYKVVIFFTPYEFQLTQYFLDSYNLEFILGKNFLLKMILAVTAIIVAFFGLIIPTAFFNNSFGKKMLNLKVRGQEKYTITINEAIVREIILKPISIACILGFIIPFFDKEKKSLHDKIMKTLVIKD